MSQSTLYQDRVSAGERLAQEVVTPLTKVTSPVRVYALPRGGIPVAVPIAQQLQCPLEVLAAKKISLPPNSELALGAVTPDGTTVWAKSPHVQRKNQQELKHAREEALASAIAQQGQFNPHCPAASVENSIVIIVDDGIATGMTMMTAVEALRKQQPAEIWVATPVAPPEIKEQFQKICDRALVLETPDPFGSVGRFYAKFSQVSTEEAIAYLQGERPA